MNRLNFFKKFLFHSHLKSTLTKQMKIIPIPLLSDNYSYLIYGSNPQEALIVDPSEGQPLINYLTKNHPDVAISHILLTHRHYDHTGGVQDLLTFLNEQQSTLKTFKKIEIYAGASENLPYVTRSFKENAVFQLTKDIRVTVFLVPCHTVGHVLYFLESTNEKAELERAVFTGDTLFLGGCGRFFEGTAKEMLANFDLISSLPKETLIYCGHEYTVSNLEWAMGVEWENEAIEAKLKKSKEIINSSGFTVPGTVAEEMEINLFMRCRHPRIMEKFKTDNPVEVMQKLRSLKDAKGSLK